MTTICPKCSYARKQTDNSPSWQCPSCQVAYSKVGDTQYLNDRETRSASSHFRAAPDQSVGSWKWVVALVVIAVVAWQGKSMFKRLSSQGSDQSSMQARSSQPQPEVILYSATWCGYCTAAREFFRGNRIRFTELDVERSAEGVEGYRKLGGGGIPVILIDGQETRGFNEGGLRKALRPWMKDS